MNAPFTLYCSPGIYMFDEEHTFGMTIVDESAVSSYLDSGKWFMNSRDAVDAFIRERDRAGKEASEASKASSAGTGSPAAVEPNSTPEPDGGGIPDWVTDEEIERVKANDNKTGNNKRRARRAGNKSSDV